MAKKKYYAIRVGKRPGIYSTWSEAEQEVKGFPGAIYKSFSTEEEALSFMAGEDSKESKDSKNSKKVSKGSSKTPSTINQKIEEEIKSLADGEVIAFVDGSYLDDDNLAKYSFGVILLTNDSEDSLCKSFTDERYLSSRNVAGEIEGVKAAISWAIKNNKHRIKIFYDYEGIEKWATKEWKTKANISQDYSKFFDQMSKLVTVEFEHVKSHSGIVYNEKVDKLARSALLSL